MASEDPGGRGGGCGLLLSYFFEGGRGRRSSLLSEIINISSSSIL